jgi:hypothetical protein
VIRANGVFRRRDHCVEITCQDDTTRIFAIGCDEAWEIPLEEGESVRGVAGSININDADDMSWRDLVSNMVASHSTILRVE